MKNGCDYYKPSRDDIANCPSCIHWLPERERCEIEHKVLRNDKTALVHEPVPPGSGGRRRFLR